VERFILCFVVEIASLPLAMTVLSMPEINDSNNIELRSENVQEIMGHIPHWIIRWGISIILLTIIILLVGTWYFKYPKIIPSEIMVTTENLPASIVARVDGKIKHLFVKDNEKVNKNDHLLIIENPASYQHIFELKEKLDTFGLFLNHLDSNIITGFDNNYSLGEIQPFYASFKKEYSDYCNFLLMDYHHKKIKSIEQQIVKYQALYYRVNNQKNILKEELKLSQEQHNRDQKLFDQGVIAESEFEKSKSALLQKKYAYEGAKTNLANTNIQISQLEQSILDYELQYEEQKKKFELSLTESFNNLKSRLAQWEQNYVLRSPINGTVTFTTYWSINQNIKAGDKVITVVPDKPSKIIGKVKLPVTGSGKVEAGQKVNIKFHNFPHLEYGMVKGKVNKISLVPADNYYAVEVGLPDSLITNYGKVLPFSQEMQGVAEIITEDFSLLERIVNPIRSILNK